MRIVLAKGNATTVIGHCAALSLVIGSLRFGVISHWAIYNSKVITHHYKLTPPQTIWRAVTYIILWVVITYLLLTFDPNTL